MSNTSPFTGLRIAGAAFAAAVLGIVVWEGRKEYLETSERSSVIKRIDAADVKSVVCPEIIPNARTGVTFIPSPDLSRTLAPLLDINDAKTDMTGQKLIDHALKSNVGFAVCDKMESTASFEKRSGFAPDQYVIKMNVQATDFQQQAAVLQLMKEFYNQGASYAGDKGRSVIADSHLSLQMPGRILDKYEVADRIHNRPARAAADRLATTVKIPMRTP